MATGTVLRGRRHCAGDGQSNSRQAPPVALEALRALVTACGLTAMAGLRDRLLLVPTAVPRTPRAPPGTP
ncbi:hypothetical protein [Actinomadura keratinilytica]|uniref:Uncharacterized protein n=1 Tax=Actinomadura keratinilytica TaxID=547461 RepID=A0ABP7ZHY2_9ACTN